MSNEEFEFFLSAIEFIAIYGQRFLPFYHLNWNTGSWKFNTDVFKETLLKENNCKLCTSFANNTSSKVVLQERNKNLETPETLECKTRDDTHLSEYKYYMEIAKHIGDILPKFPSGCTVPNNINADNIWFRI